MTIVQEKKQYFLIFDFLQNKSYIVWLDFQDLRNVQIATQCFFFKLQIASLMESSLFHFC